MLDFNVDSKTHAAYGTVVASRVRSREDVLILRPFPLWLFQRGAAEGPELLLRKLKGEIFDWEAMREARWPKGYCNMCKEHKSIDLFAWAQWELVRANRDATCLGCQHADNSKKALKRNFNDKQAMQNRVQCTACGVIKIQDAFPRAQLVQPNAESRRQCTVCRSNLAELTCTNCGRRKEAAEFSASMRTMADDAVACFGCQQEVKGKAKRLRTGWFSCQTCKESFPETGVGNEGNTQCTHCASRSARQAGWQKCSNRKCGKKFQSKGRGLCPACAPRGRPSMRKKKDNKNSEQK